MHAQLSQSIIVHSETLEAGSVDGEETWASVVQQSNAELLRLQMSHTFCVSRAGPNSFGSAANLGLSILSVADLIRL